jgi:hypothetical protein
VVSFTITGTIQTIATKLTVTTPVVLLTATKRTTIVSIIAAEITGNTPTLSIELYDGTTSYYLRFQAAMTANGIVTIDTPFVLNVGWSLRATAGTANRIDIILNHLTADATAVGSFVPNNQR